MKRERAKCANTIADQMAKETEHLHVSRTIGERVSDKAVPVLTVIVAVVSSFNQQWQV